jgi:hypothetical protein
VVAGGAGSCVYGWCSGDTACDPGQLCDCGEAAASNRCVSAGCNLDSDCPGSYCSPTLGDCGAYGGTVGYYCHTPSDECIDDADCSDGGYCKYDLVRAHWVCGAGTCVG